MSLNKLFGGNLKKLFYDNIISFKKLFGGNLRKLFYDNIIFFINFAEILYLLKSYYAKKLYFLYIINFVIILFFINFAKKLYFLYYKF